MQGISDMQLLVVQPTPFCNLNCTYCYLPHRSNKTRMTENTLAALGRSVVGSAFFKPETTIVWHAGEPCVLSPDWYRNARKTLEDSSGKQIERQSFQTNATLITDDWIAFLREPGLAIGVSLDGPEFINDLWRKGRSGQGTYARTMRGINRLFEAEIPFHVIAVVSEASLDHPVEIAETLIATGAHTVCLNVEEIEGENETSTLLSDRSRGRYRRFLSRFAETIARHPSPPRFREGERLARFVTAGSLDGTTGNQENSPGAIVSIGVDGALSTFSPELLGTKSQAYNDFVFGNVHDLTDLSQAFMNRNFLRMLRDISTGVAHCRKSCAFFGMCGGGSPSNKFGEFGRFDVAETAHCDLTVKTTVDVLLERLEHAAE